MTESEAKIIQKATIYPAAILNNMLHELLIIPKYESIIQKSRLNHTLGYKMKVTCPIKPGGECLSVESSYWPTKKQAKHDAALRFLIIFLDYEYTGDIDIRTENQTANLANESQNLLKIICMRKSLEQPKIRDISVAELPETLAYTAECNVADLTIQGHGKNQSEARLHAAARMIQILTETRTIHEILKLPQIGTCGVQPFTLKTKSGDKSQTETIENCFKRKPDINSKWSLEPQKRFKTIKKSDHNRKISISTENPSKNINKIAERNNNLFSDVNTIYAIQDSPDSPDASDIKDSPDSPYASDIKDSPDSPDNNILATEANVTFNTYEQVSPASSNHNILATASDGTFNTHEQDSPASPDNNISATASDGIFNTHEQEFRTVEKLNETIKIPLITIDSPKTDREIVELENHSLTNENVSNSSKDSQYNISSTVSTAATSIENDVKVKKTNNEEIKGRLTTLQVASINSRALRSLEKKKLYNEIVNALVYSNFPCQKTVTVHTNYYQVFIDENSPPKILEGDNECTDASMITTIKFLIDLKKRIELGDEDFDENELLS